MVEYFPVLSMNRSQIRDAILQHAPQRIEVEEIVLTDAFCTEFCKRLGYEIEEAAKDGGVETVMWARKELGL